MLRPGRTARPVVAVTGAEAGLGRVLVERLAVREDVATVVGLLRPLPDGQLPLAVTPRAGVLWRPADDPAALADVDTVVHLGTTYDVSLPARVRRDVNVRGTSRLLEDALEAGVRRVVLVTSADVWGSVADTELPLPDGAPLRAVGEDDTLLGDHVEIERLAEHAVRTGLWVTVLRPATLVGGPLGAAYDGQALRQLGAPRLLALRGVEPMWQLCHTADLVSALELAAVGEVAGCLAVGCDGALPQARVEQLTGRTRLELPPAVALSTAERLHRLGITASSPRELDHLLSPLVVQCDGLRAAGWTAAWTNEGALLAHLATRPTDGRASAATAAGATVALLGTAAVVRARRRRGRR